MGTYVFIDQDRWGISAATDIQSHSTIDILHLPLHPRQSASPADPSKALNIGIKPVVEQASY